MREYLRYSYWAALSLSFRRISILYAYEDDSLESPGKDIHVTDQEGGRVGEHQGLSLRDINTFLWSLYS